MAFDQHKNLAIATVTTATGAAGTTLGVGVGEGARFPAVPFNATVWPVDMAPDPTTAEVVRVTARTGDSLTITRAQEGTTARAIIVGDMVAATITAKALTDIESGVNFPLITTGAITGTTGTLSGNLSVNGGLKFSGGFGAIATTTPDGADNSFLQLTGGGAGGHDRAATVNLFGNEHGGVGKIQIYAGDVAGGGSLEFFTGASLLRGTMHRSGGFSWGGTTDPGAGNFSIGGDAGSVPVLGIVFNGIQRNGIVLNDTSDTAAVGFARFKAVGVEVGAIERSGAGTLYKTTSDARLKTPLRRHMETAVLRDTVIHDFIWNADGTAGRGVFAQEAHTVAPFAVSVGTDDVDEEGRLTHPWGVDYSKYVPDLITGWQSHETSLNDIRGEVALLRAKVGLIKREGMYAAEVMARPSPFNRMATAIRRIFGMWFPSWITP